MKTSLSSFDLRTLVAEWQDLVGGHIDKAYQRKDEVILRINAPAGGKAELFYKAGRWLCLHEVENKPESPPPFAQTLRRLLANARITSVEQSGFDRIAVFHLEHGGGAVDLVFEVFGKGNVAAVRDGVTFAAMFPQTFKDRSVQVGEPYVFPRAGIDPLGLDRDALARTLRGAKGQVVRVLASILNLGGTYAEELCLRAGIDKETKVKEISDPQVDALYTALNNVSSGRSRTPSCRRLPGGTRHRCNAHRARPVPRPRAAGVPHLQRGAFPLPDGRGAGNRDGRKRRGQIRTAHRSTARILGRVAGGSGAP